MRYSLFALGVTVLAACLVGGCSSRSDVSLTGNTPSRYAHVFITTQEVWFNQDGTAGPDDAGWTKFTLSSPTTVDLVEASGGTLGSIKTGLRLLPGTYKQIRLIPLDSSAALATSASDLGAKYNAEADYPDSNGTLQQVPLELLNPDKGIAVSGSLRVPVASFGTAAAAAFGTSTTNTTTNSPFGTNTATNTGTNTTTGNGTTKTTGTTTTTAFTLSLDGARDLVPFSFGSCAGGTAATPAASCAGGILLSSHAGAFNLDNVGGISGTLTLTNLTNTSGIQATAETVSADGTRHVAVLSTPVRSDGTFLLYPLPSSSSNAAVYDVVIHGPGMATIIVKSVSVTITASSTTDTSTTTTGASNTATGTGTNTATNTTTNTGTTNPSTSSNTVSLGTMTPRAATSFAANMVTRAGSPLTADAQVGFYQGLSGSGEVPYQIEAAPIDPFNQVLASAQSLSAGTIDSGTYAASGNTITLFSAAPAQGAGTYWVAASAPSYANGTLSNSVQVTAPATSTTAPVIATVPALSAASGVALGSLQVSITPSSPGAYDSGELLLSHDGTLISRVSLAGVVSSGGTVSASVPTGTPASIYFLSVRFWQSGDPANTLRRQWYPSGVNMSGGGNASIALTIN
ncbi:MAG: hypothetical protein JSR36_00040 [Proteobacteria bacterium]|nr:hypothetical protein [Pseudomonadota bacterium]